MQTQRSRGDRVIVRSGNRSFIHHNESRRFFSREGSGGSFKRQIRPDGISVATVRRRHGTVHSEFDRNGRLIRRYREGPGGRQFVMIDNRRYYQRGIGLALGLGAAAIVLAPLAYASNYQGYAVEYDDASYDDITYALGEGPVEPLARRYSLVEILDSYSLRERLRRIDVDTIRFRPGSAVIPEAEYRKLARLARALLFMIERNPDEVYLIEGHASDDGSDMDPLALSDERAEAVADILTNEFEVPAENLVTQGYGDEILRTQWGARRVLNRVTVRRVTPILAQGEDRGEDRGEVPN